MSYITEIDVERINSFNKMSTDNGKGVQIRDALTAYQNRMYSISANGFEWDDNSTAQGVINSLAAQSGEMLALLQNVDVLFDDAIRMLEEDVIGKEDQLAAGITEV